MVIIIKANDRWKMFFIWLILASGIATSLGVSNNKITDRMGSISITWGILLVLGSTLSLLAKYWRGRIVTSLLIERSGMWALGGASWLWATLVLWTAHIDGAFTAAITIWFGWICISEARIINRNIRQIIHDIDDSQTE